MGIRETKRGTTATTKLLQAATFAAALVPLSSVAAEASHIMPNVYCKTETAGCIAAFASGFNSHTWGFYSEVPPEIPGSEFDPAEYFYTVTIAGVASAGFTLEVEDDVVPQGALGGGQCVPMRSGNQCAYFDVRLFSGALSFVDGFTLTLTWYDMSGGLTAASLFRRPNPSGEFELVTGTTFIPGEEPEISGKLNVIGQFAVATSVPESGTTLPLAMVTMLALVLAASRANR